MAVLPVAGKLQVITSEPTPPVRPVSTVACKAGRIWMDRNLGASRVATSMIDGAAYGDLYQWGRRTDGHEKRNSGTTDELSDTDSPGHTDFIKAPLSPYDWRIPPKDSLWLGKDGINNPCPQGFRLPTAEEFQKEINSWSPKDRNGAFESPLKLSIDGSRSSESGALVNTEVYGFYWTSSVKELYARCLAFNAVVAGVDRGGNLRANGFSVRCIKD